MILVIRDKQLIPLNNKSWPNLESQWPLFDTMHFDIQMNAIP
jgi:hypothetical protein